MAARLSSFLQLQPIRSALVKNPPEGIPSIDELEQLQSELKSAKHTAAERRRKAIEDLKTLAESMRRMTEKEKGKSKAIDKIKRERDCERHIFNFNFGFCLTVPVTYFYVHVAFILHWTFGHP